MQTAVGLPARSDTRPVYHPRGPDPVRRLFLRRFPEFQAAYEQRYASMYGRFRLPLIVRAASAETGTRASPASRPRYSVAFRCPACGFDRFRPFSCKSYLPLGGALRRLCPSCAQKRTLLIGEYLSEDLLLRLPHRQAVQWPARGFVWTIPKVLRVFLRHDRDLFADISRLLFDILTSFFSQAAGRTLRCAMVSSHQTFGEFSGWHRHWHSIVLEGGFDRHDRFFFIPLGASEALSEIWRRRAVQWPAQGVVALFLQKGLLNPDFARKLLGWEHSGFSIESGTRIWDQDSREALCQYIVRAPFSLQRIRWDEQQDAITWSSSPSGYFKGRQRRYSSLDFIAQVTVPIPPRGRHLVRRYGLYSSRGRGTWKDRPALRSRAPANWYGRQAADDSALPDAPKDQEVGVLARRKAWARLLAKVHELDVRCMRTVGSATNSHAANAGSGSQTAGLAQRSGAESSILATQKAINALITSLVAASESGRDHNPAPGSVCPELPAPHCLRRAGNADRNGDCQAGVFLPLHGPAEAAWPGQAARPS